MDQFKKYEEFVNFSRAFIQMHGISQTEFARMAGTDKATVSRFLDGKPISSLTFFRIIKIIIQ